MSVQTLIQVRRGSTTEWSSANTTLSAGEWGYDTVLKKYKIGDGLTSWNSLPYASILPNSSDIIGVSGVGIQFSNTTGSPITISVTGIISSQVSDFNSAVDSRITSAAISEEEVQDIIASGDHITTGFLRNGTGVVINYNDTANTVTINVSGYSLSEHNHDDRYYTETELNTSGGGGQVHWDNLTNKPSTFTPSSHNHTWSEITDASSKATLNELAYLSGVVAGTASASRAIVLDSSKNIAGINTLSTDGNITVGGNLTVQGTTTTVNSTTVNIGDNIVRVNTSGLTTGGFEVYTGSDYKQLVWNVSNNRWEFSGGNIYTSGNFIGNLTGNASTVTNGVYTTDTGSVTSAMILDGTIVNSDINASAAIAVTKLASSGVTLGSTVVNLGQTSTVLDGLTRISGVSAASPVYIHYAVIDGGTP